VIQWWRSSVPSNSLSGVYGLARNVPHRNVLGPDVSLRVEARGETTAVLPLRRIIRRFQRNGLRGLACVVGVQTKQFRRAVDIARQRSLRGERRANDGDEARAQ
jgi:hypothetical protein